MPTWLLVMLYGAAASVVLLLGGHRLYVWCAGEAGMDGYEIIVREPSGGGLAEAAVYSAQQRDVAGNVPLMSPLRLAPALLCPPQQQTTPGSSSSSPLSTSFPLQTSYISTDEEDDAAAAEKELKQVWSV